ncbi:winged helix-turn-helix transcriptional regulator [Natronocalculus amylovorans]|uniref:Winged helix-turn-helix transcriptional regulator n=1 Tax=Natronocalculus amylovorans TaxID=2917812 RepID=A0AAE3FY57_9EURY|nr:winged helix-turn-helix transcriptional regulator [Natronocalculus amylovorans]MCL9817173.1 winged helix-turn-helix transcriptional regulator [Natronocalculus amylovorans]
MSDTRTQIYQRIENEPGIHFNALVRELEFAPGQVQHHIKRLLRSERVIKEPRDGRTHYFVPTFEPWERCLLTRYRRETSRDILLYLLSEGPSTPTAVSESVGIARSTLSWHTDRLVADEIVEKERDIRGHVTLSLSDPERTAALLEAVTPRPTERATDRFTRLFDGLLDG